MRNCFAHSKARRGRAPTEADIMRLMPRDGSRSFSTKQHAEYSATYRGFIIRPLIPLIPRVGNAKCET